MRRTVNLCGTKYNLDGSPTSLVARIFNGNNGSAPMAYNPSGSYSPNQNYWVMHPLNEILNIVCILCAHWILFNNFDKLIII